MGQSWPCLWEAGPTVMHSTKQVTWNKGQKGLQQKTCFQSCLLVFQFLACLPERQMFYLRDLWCSLSMRKRWLTQTLWLSRYHLQLDGQVLPLSSYLKLFSISSFLGGLKSTFCFVCLFVCCCFWDGLSYNSRCKNKLASNSDQLASCLPECGD